MVLVYLPHYLKKFISNIIPTLYHHIYGFSMFNTLTKALHEIVSILQVISSFFVFNKPLEIPSYIPLFSQCYLSEWSYGNVRYPTSNTPYEMGEDVVEC